MLLPVAALSMTLSVFSDDDEESDDIFQRSVLLGNPEMLFQYLYEREQGPDFQLQPFFGKLKARLARWTSEAKNLDDLHLRLGFFVNAAALSKESRGWVYQSPWIWNSHLGYPWSDPLLIAGRKCLKKGWNPGSQANLPEVPTFGSPPIVSISDPDAIPPMSGLEVRAKEREEFRKKIEVWTDLGVQITRYVPKALVLSWDDQRCLVDQEAQRHSMPSHVVMMDRSQLPRL